MSEKLKLWYNNNMNKPIKGSVAIGHVTMIGILSIVVAGLVSYYSAQAATTKSIAVISERVTILETNYEHIDEGIKTLLKRTEN